jgi:predicted AlkP superfamily phosphohydrolase/phosphomutase
MCEEGRLPLLASLRQRGAHGILQTVPNMNSAPAWSTIATGLDPGRHGIFYFDEPVPGTYRRTLVNASRRSGRSLWRIASEAGLRVVVVNVPISYPAEAVHGFMVAGLDTPAKSLPGFTHPEDLPRRYPRLFDAYVIEPGVPSLMRAGREEEAKDKLRLAVDGWTSVTERLMEEPWDLVFVVFTSTDTAQHFFWTGDRRRVVEAVYEAQDQATARLVAKARAEDPDVNVMVLADHGGAANSRGPEFMPIWLEDQGLQTRTAPAPAARVLAAGFRFLDRTLSREHKQNLARWFPAMRERAESEARLAGIEWTQTKAYADGLRDEVLLNVDGREPLGVVPKADYAHFAGELAAMIRGIRELDTDRSPVASVTPRSGAYHGPFIERAPDLTIRWTLDADRPFRGFQCRTPSATKRMRAIAERPPFTDGGHHPEGLFAAAGPDVSPGQVSGALADVAPTVLSLLGVPVPEDLDGRPLATVRTRQPATSSADDARPATTEEPPTVDTRDSQTGYTPAEEAAVRRRLEELGYL